MARSLEHRSTYPEPVATVYSTLVDEGFLTDRLRAIGGKGAALLDHSRAGDAVTFTLRQGVDAERLPSAVRSVLGGDLVVERTERWRPDGPRYAADTRVSISGVPGSIQGQSRLGEHGGESLLVVRAEVRVSIPLVGGKLEKVVVEQVTKLLATEAEFAEKWLAERA
ncbi:MAG TPA: DUF2505 domain-containing protein [Actinophytocola sp.]|nr:DUF2505 domain-containing protein [Actinophytocola sp.]